VRSATGLDDSTAVSRLPIGAAPGHR